MKTFLVKYWIGKCCDKKGKCYIDAKDKGNAFDNFCNKYSFYDYFYDPYDIIEVEPFEMTKKSQI